MRAYHVFAGMAPDRATALLGALREKSPATYEQALALASAALRARPVYLRRQTLEQQAQAARRAFSRVAANEAAEEVLATYFLECEKALLLEWLDAVGVEHEDGTLSGTPTAPPADELRAAVEAFRKGGDDWKRELLLRAFAAQSAVDWPELDALLGS